MGCLDVIHQPLSLILFSFTEVLMAAQLTVWFGPSTHFQRAPRHFN